jgi:hypothetical protein
MSNVRSALVGVMAASALWLAGCSPTSIPGPSPSSEVQTPAPSTATGGVRAIDCGQLRTTIVDCLAVLDMAAGALSADVPRDKISSVRVLDGRRYQWCAPPYCVAAPPRSVWVEFDWGSSWERIPAYIDPLQPDSGWQVGFPFDLLPSPSPESSAIPSPS